MSFLQALRLFYTGQTSITLDWKNPSHHHGGDTLIKSKMVALQAAQRNVSSQGMSLRAEDVLVFIGLESLGTLAITGNLCLIIVLLKNKYLQRAR